MIDGTDEYRPFYESKEETEFGISLDGPLEARPCSITAASPNSWGT